MVVSEAAELVLTCGAQPRVEYAQHTGVARLPASARPAPTPADACLCRLACSRAAAAAAAASAMPCTVGVSVLPHELPMHQPPPSLRAGFYLACSAGMSIFNKLAVTELPLPFTLVCIQMTFTVSSTLLSWCVNVQRIRPKSHSTPLRPDPQTRVPPLRPCAPKLMCQPKKATPHS